MDLFSTVYWLFIIARHYASGVGDKVGGGRKEKGLLLLWADLLTGSFWRSQESDSGLLVFSGVKSQRVKTVCFICSLVAWAPHCLLPQCWFQVQGTAELEGAWEGGPTHSEEALRDKFKGATSQIIVYFYSPRELVKMQILPQTLLSSSLARNIEQTFMCYTISPCWLSILNLAMCT